MNESKTKQNEKRIFRGAVLAAAVLMLAAVLFVGAGAAAGTEIATADEFYQFVAAVNASTGEDDTFTAVLTGDFTLDNKIIFNPAVKTNVIIDLNGHVITSTYITSSSILLKTNTVLEIYDDGGSIAEHPYTAVTVTVMDKGAPISVSTAGGSITGGGIVWQPVSSSVDYSSAGTPTTDGDESGYDNSAPCGKCIQVGSGAVLKIHGGTFANFVGHDGGAILSRGSTFMDGGLISRCKTLGGYKNANYGFGGGGVAVDSGSRFVMSGGEISECEAVGGGPDYGGGGMAGGVFVGHDSSFIMSGGKICLCTAFDGGGVAVDSGSTFEMSGGEISQCKQTEYENGGGGVFVGTCHTKSGLAPAAFTMSGGTISECEANANAGGGGVYVYMSSTFTMIGGLISKCSSEGFGGGVAAAGSGGATIIISGGTISECSTSNDGGGVFVGTGSKCRITGGVFENNHAVGYGGGLHTSYKRVILTGGIFRGNTDCNGNTAISSRLQNTGVGSMTTFYLGGSLTLEDDQAFRIIDLPTNSAEIGKIGTPNSFNEDDGFTDEKFTGSVKNIVIENEELDGLTLFEIKSGQNASDVLGRLSLKDTDKWTLTADDDSDPKKIVLILNKPAADSVYYDWNNDGTAVNVSVALSGANDADSVKVLFYNSTDKAYFTVTNPGSSKQSPTHTSCVWTYSPTVLEDAKATSVKLDPGATGNYSLAIGSAYFTVKTPEGGLQYYSSPTLQRKNTASVNPTPEMCAALYRSDRYIGYAVTFTPSNTIVGTAAGSSFAKGSIIPDIKLENLVPGNPYTVKVVLENCDFSNWNFGYNFETATYEIGLPKISEHPQSAVYQKGAAAAALQVTAAGTSLTYLWENSTDGTTFTEMTGETGGTFTPSTAELGTVYYRVNVTDTDSGKSVYSLTAEIEVYSTYSITYNPKEGSLPSASNPLVYSSNESFALNDPVRQYYVGSWINAATDKPVSVIYKGTTGDLTLNAAYVPREYAITYNEGGVSANPQSYNVTSGTIILTDASRAGYKFLGWYDNAAFTGAKVTTISSAAPKDIEVYGRWVQQTAKVVTADDNVSFSSFEGTAVPRILGTETVLTGIDGLAPGKNITFSKARPDISSSTLPSQSGYYTNVYSVFDIGYDGIMSGEAQITLNVTLAAGDSADSLHAMHNDGSGWTDLINVSKTQTGNKVTIVGNTSSFSPFAVVSYSEKPQPQHSSSRNDGTSVWLTATPTPVPTDAAPAAQPTQGVPSASPVKPAQTSSSPVPFVGILAGLGAAAVLLRLRK